MDIQINFINHSKPDTDSSDIVIFQKNLTSRLEQIAVAWQVISNSSPGSTTPFTFPQTLKVAATDSFGASTALLPASSGQMFHLHLTPSGEALSYLGPAASKTSIQVRNDLPIGSSDANIYRAGKLLATKTGIPPKEKASFRFNSTIWIGVVSQLMEGQIMNQAILSSVTTWLSLEGILNADIVMTGGGQGSRVVPFKFKLQNVVRVG